MKESREAVKLLDEQPTRFSDGGTDSALVEKARQGDAAAFGELVRRHRARTFGWASLR